MPTAGGNAGESRDDERVHGGRVPTRRLRVTEMEQDQTDGQAGLGGGRDIAVLLGQRQPFLRQRVRRSQLGAHGVRQDQAIHRAPAHRRHIEALGELAQAQEHLHSIVAPIAAEDEQRAAERVEQRHLLAPPPGALRSRTQQPERRLEVQASLLVGEV